MLLKDLPVMPSVVGIENFLIYDTVASKGHTGKARVGKRKPSSYILVNRRYEGMASPLPLTICR